MPDLAMGGLLLPGFLRRAEDGLYVEISLLESEENFRLFVDQVFASNACFAELDYPLFLKLLYELELLELPTRRNAMDATPAVRLAKDITPFTPERQKLYREAKIAKDGKTAEYLFEPVMMEQEVELPVFGPPSEDPSVPRPILGYEKRKQLSKAKLDPDEFIAAMWLQGIRYGLDMRTVRAMIKDDSTGRLEIAHMLEPFPGRDANIVEQSDTMHRDDAPKRLSDGRVDLSTFSNHFPQVAAGTRLLRKIPRALGKPGWDVRGTIFEPPVPKDLDMERLSGPGTRIEVTAQGDFIVAVMAGFLCIDTKSNLLSVSEKIVSKQGVSMETTGNLELTGLDYEEHGEVLEKRQVIGHNMTFFSDVFGQAISDGGKIDFKSNLAGGVARSPLGVIVVEGTASNATVEAQGGEIEINIAHNTLVIGRKVKILQAVNCDIVAEEIEIENCAACAILGKSVLLHTSKDWKSTETLVSIQIPDASAWDSRREDLDKQLADIRKTMTGKEENAAQISSQPEVQKFLALRAKVELGEIKIAPAQEAGWKTTVVRFASVTRLLEKLLDDVRKMKIDEDYLVKQLEKLTTSRTTAEDAVSVEVREVTGDTIVRTRKGPVEGMLFDTLTPKELHARLRESGNAEEKLYSSDYGSFNWRITPAH
ncbi:MAG: FapA family protein [Proteobacteria bacterium]|nr:FapA family protein [Pseudomonadota bacterium]